MSLTLARSLRIDEPQCVAFVGSGGKTTAIFQLANQLTLPVIVTATSHLGVWQTSGATIHIRTDNPLTVIDELEKDLRGTILVTGYPDENRIKPVDEPVIRRLHAYCKDNNLPLLIEADGSRQKPLKAWAEHEPPIPEFVDHVVEVVGLSGLIKPLSENFVHRAEIFSKISGLHNNDRITPEALIQVLLHRESALKNIPVRALRTILLNQADTSELQGIARGMVASLHENFNSVIIARLEEERVFAAHEPIAGIILAAGESSRYGTPKQLLAWKGEPFVRVIAKKALEAGLSPVILVTGVHTEEVNATVKDLNVKCLRNTDWKSGQASSIKIGISHLLSSNHHNSGGAIFLLADQPQITASILDALKEKHAEGLYPIIAPMVMDRRANPVLFDRSTFPELLTLEGDIGGRAIFHNHRVEYLPWHDDRLLLDVDTPEQYARLISDETL